MLKKSEMAAILESLKAPILFADTEHITRYMNRAAIAHYEGGEDLIGRSLLECHNEDSQTMIKEILHLMIHEGLEEREISEEDGHKIFMRVVRNSTGGVLGYYERYEPIVNQ
jgi:PAS domain S-box-containing protein